MNGLFLSETLSDWTRSLHPAANFGMSPNLYPVQAPAKCSVHLNNYIIEINIDDYFLIMWKCIKYRKQWKRYNLNHPVITLFFPSHPEYIKDFSTYQDDTAVPHVAGCVLCHFLHPLLAGSTPCSVTSRPPTFLSRLLVPEEWRAFRKPAVVDQRVGFFLDGGSSVWTRDSLPPNGPLMVSRAGSLLRRTWRGISERKWC